MHYRKYIKYRNILKSLSKSHPDSFLFFSILKFFFSLPTPSWAILSILIGGGGICCPTYVMRRAQLKK